jgi:hypothetical protein
MTNITYLCLPRGTEIILLMTRMSRCFELWVNSW